MPSLDEALSATAALHHHLCPKQVLGVRMGMLAGDALGLDLPQTGKRLLAIVETDGCTADGIAVAANCWVGHRTMRVEDHGKVAATFADTVSGRAVRILPRIEARTLALNYAPEARDSWEGMLLGYQRIPADLLFSVRSVRLSVPLEELVSRPDLKTRCEFCGEEVINGRELRVAGRAVCRSCAGFCYYHLDEADGRPMSGSTPACLGAKPSEGQA